MTLSLDLAQTPSPHPWDENWPLDELEHVPTCPMCGSAHREVLLDGLVDNVFFVAPGRWTLHRCNQCSSAYLDPRPNSASIGKAYGTYYTHVAGAEQRDAAPPGFLRRVKIKLSNGYWNERYGTQRHPASSMGVWIAKFFSRRRETLDIAFRYLPKPTPGQRLLDIGCGNGDFLIHAQEAGWQVCGLEPDPKAAATTRERGLEVLVGTVDLLASESSCFDAITLSHVIEHVHEPRQLLQAVHRLLKPGGMVYIETPNIKSQGAHVFGKNWRGLETPRHLVLFNPASLKSMLSVSGFRDIQLARRTTVRQGMYLSSLRMLAGRSPYDAEPARLPWWERLRLRLDPKNLSPTHLEFITLTARKL